MLVAELGGEVVERLTLKGPLKSVGAVTLTGVCCLGLG